jgi:hypothetical protein
MGKMKINNDLLNFVFQSILVMIPGEGKENED